MKVNQLLYLMPEEQAVGIIFYAYNVQHSSSVGAGFTAKELLDNLPSQYLQAKVFHVFSKNGMIRMEATLTEWKRKSN